MNAPTFGQIRISDFRTKAHFLRAEVKKITQNNVRIQNFNESFCDNHGQEKENSWLLAKRLLIVLRKFFYCLQ